MIEIYDEIFHKNLLLTQTYCELQLKNGDNDAATALRTFNPVYNDEKLFSYEEGNCAEYNFTSVQWSSEPLWQNPWLYEELFEKQLVHKRALIESIDNNKKFEGRILVAEIDLTVVDGASEVESKGFIDVNDCPPIDTWFYKILDDSHRIFFAWIPQYFVELVDEAIAVNCVDCMSWYEDWLLREKVSNIEFKKAGSKTSFLKHINKLFGK